MKSYRKELWLNIASPTGYAELAIEWRKTKRRLYKKCVAFVERLSSFTAPPQANSKPTSNSTPSRLSAKINH